MDVTHSLSLYTETVSGFIWHCQNEDPRGTSQILTLRLRQERLQVVGVWRPVPARQEISERTKQHHAKKKWECKILPLNSTETHSRLLPHSDKSQAGHFHKLLTQKSIKVCTSTWASKHSSFLNAQRGRAFKSSPAFLRYSRVSITLRHLLHNSYLFWRT